MTILQNLKSLGVLISFTTAVGCQREGQSPISPSNDSTLEATHASLPKGPFKFKGGVYAKEVRYGHDYGQFDAEVIISNVGQALADGFSGYAQTLPVSEPGDDPCQYVVRSHSKATLELKIFRTKPGEKLKTSVFDRTYGIVFTASRSGLSPCKPFETQDFTAVIEDLISEKDLNGQGELLPLTKIIDEAPGRGSFPVLALGPTVNIKYDKNSSQIEFSQVSLDVRISEYLKRDGKVSMAETGSYYHGFGEHIPLK